MSGVLFATFKVAEYEHLSQRKLLSGFFTISVSFIEDLISGDILLFLQLQE
jgi:hypothetical protein